MRAKLPQSHGSCWTSGGSHALKVAREEVGREEKNYWALPARQRCGLQNVCGWNRPRLRPSHRKALPSSILQPHSWVRMEHGGRHAHHTLLLWVRGHHRNLQRTTSTEQECVHVQWCQSRDSGVSSRETSTACTSRGRAATRLRLALWISSLSSNETRCSIAPIRPRAVHSARHDMT